MIPLPKIFCLTLKDTPKRKEYAEKPILWCNPIDEIIYPDENPPVIFPCGSILDGDNFLVSFGFNDEKTGIIKI